MRKLRVKSVFLLCVVLFFNCSKGNDSKADAPGEQALVTINGKTLYKSDLEEIIPSGDISSQDSASAAEAYVNLWINDQLMYEVAKKNVTDKAKIDELVENYRQSLTVFSYQEQLLKERFSEQKNEKALKEYYDTNQDKFKLESNIIKGLFLKVPKNSPELENFKKWYRSTSKTALEGIEKNAMQHAVVYEYFYDKWVNFDEIMARIPYRIKNSETFLRNEEELHVRDSAYVYLLNIKEYALIGEKTPFDYAKPQVLEVMRNQNKSSFLKQFEKELYDKAVKDDRIKFHYKKNQK